MGNFDVFMKQNKVVDSKEYEFAPTKSLLGPDKKPIKWKFKKLSLDQYNKIKNAFTKTQKIGEGKDVRYLPQLDSDGFNATLITESCIYPDLHDKTLQDSYGVCDANALLYAMVDNPGEYTDLVLFMQDLYGFGDNDLVKQAKN